MAIQLMQQLLLLLLLSVLSHAAPISSNRRAPDPSLALPSQDSFFQPPADYECAKPGDILRSRQVAVPSGIELLAPGKVKTVWQILYRSQDDHGKPLAVVTTLLVPNNADPNKFYTQAIAYDSSDVDCSPSYTLRSSPNTVPETAVIVLALNSGWYVQSPDYESYKMAFTNGIISGQTLLDSLRAGKKSGSFTGLSSNPRMGLNGASGGALACEWALELQPTYATDISIAGATLGSLTPNIINVMRTVNGGANAGLIPASITGLAQVSPRLNAYLRDNLIASTASDFRSATTRCLPQNTEYFQNKDITAYFKNPDIFNNSELYNLAQKVGVMGKHGTPTGPVYIYKGAQDEISPVADTDALVDKFCEDNAPSVTYIRNELTTHAEESVLGLPGAFAWLNDRFNGVAAQPGCTTTTVS